jgi:23S rRNA pseudouridine2605 synthase
MPRRRFVPKEGRRSNVPGSSHRIKFGSGRAARPVQPRDVHTAGAREAAGAEQRSEEAATAPGPDVKRERLQKILAHAGLGSRRACEELISEGRVTVDGQVVRQLGTRVDSATARIAVDGEPIKLETNVYYAVNKPKGHVSTSSDPAGRPRVADLLPEIPQRVYTVGRLDEDSTGLMILTNDGELANRLAHPRYGVEKTYRALVAGHPQHDTIARLTEGIWLSDGKVRAKRARVVGRQGQATMLELVLAEGKKREVRRMLAKLGHKVMSLNRIAVGPITLQGLGAGECRPLSRREIDLLRAAAFGAPGSARAFSDSKGPSSSRPHRESRHRTRRIATVHAAPEEGEPRNKPPRQRRPGQSGRFGAGRIRSPRPDSLPAASGTPSGPKAGPHPSKRRKAATKTVSQERRGPAGGSGPGTAATGKPHAGARPRRRIIGLPLGQLGSSGSSIAGRPIRRRPPRLKRGGLRAADGTKPAENE